ncbi:hypothetical protein GCM10008997_07710 [Halomonas salifodinae]
MQAGGLQALHISIAEAGPEQGQGSVAGIGHDTSGVSEGAIIRSWGGNANRRGIAFAMADP